MRRHYSTYFKVLVNFKPYRTKLVELEEKDELFAVLDEIEEKFQYEPMDA